MPARRRASTALIDDPGLPGESDLDQDVTPAKRGPGRPRKSTTAAPAKRPGRKPGSVSVTAARNASGQIMSKRQMMDNVAGELGLILTIGVGALELRDPEMAAAFIEPINLGRLGEVDPIEGFTDRIVNLLARNEKALAYAAKGGVVTEVAIAGFIAFTVARRMGQISADRRTEGAVDLDGYPAYQPAAAA